MKEAIENAIIRLSDIIGKNVLVRADVEMKLSQSALNLANALSTLVVTDNMRGDS